MHKVADGGHFFPITRMLHSQNYKTFTLEPNLYSSFFRVLGEKTELLRLCTRWRMSAILFNCYSILLIKLYNFCFGTNSLTAQYHTKPTFSLYCRLCENCTKSHLMTIVKNKKVVDDVWEGMENISL
mgnify:CR=1 FL=1